MGKKRQESKSADLIPIRWILGSLTIVTLYFQTTLADPFNSPKLWILLIMSAWLTGHILSYRKIIFSNKSIKNLFYLIFAFLCVLLLSTLASDFHYVAFFGETQRRNGFLQYFSLSIIMVAASIFVRLHNVRKIFGVTYFVASVSVIYSLMQTTGNDFVNWNNPYNSVISTLGNPNFAAAVMAVMGVLTFSSTFIPAFKLQYRIFAVGLCVLLLFAIYRSNARQGLLAYALGIGIFLIVWMASVVQTLRVGQIWKSLAAILVPLSYMLPIIPYHAYFPRHAVVFWLSLFVIFVAMKDSLNSEFRGKEKTLSNNSIIHF